MTLSGCSGCNPGPNVYHTTVTDNPTCETACENLKTLGCPEANPASDGRSCVDFCKDVINFGLFAYDVACVTYAKSPGSLKVCNVRCAK